MLHHRSIRVAWLGSLPYNISMRSITTAIDELPSTTRHGTWHTTRSEPLQQQDVPLSRRTRSAQRLNVASHNRKTEERRGVLGSIIATNFDNFNIYSTSAAPNEGQLKYARQFFRAQSPNLMYSQANFRLLPQSTHPEVVFLGRSNVGKSSMLNSLFGRQGVALTSSKPGKTRLMNAFGVSPYPLSAAPQSGTKGEIMNESWRRFRGGLFVVDMPGYGTGSREAWGKEIMKYVENRKQLRRAFLLIDIEHGVKSTDLAILIHLSRHGIPHTIVLSKVDKVIHPRIAPPTDTQFQKGLQELTEKVASVRKILKEEVWAGREPANDFLCVSSERTVQRNGISGKIGIDELRWATLCACGLEESGGKTKIMSDITIID